MKIGNFFIIKSVFIPTILLASLAVSVIFAHLQVEHNSHQFLEVFKTQNIKSLAEADTFALSRNIGHLIGKYDFKCLIAKNDNDAFLVHGEKDCKPTLLESTSTIYSPSKNIAIYYVMQLSNSWYILLTGLMFLQSILGILIYFINSQFEKKLNQQEKKRSLDLIRQAKQVAHDIRSPLAVIKSMKNDDPLTQNAVNRLDDIAQELLGDLRNKKDYINNIAQQIFAEKQKEFPETNFSLKINEKNNQLTETVVLSRILSNLLNNSAQASSHVQIETTANSVVISDKGKGIPPNVIAALERDEGLSTKDNGHGLGLIHAKKECTKVGAKLSIDTSPQGTSIILSWPNLSNRQALLLEDDPLIARMWKLEAERRNIELLTFTQFADLNSFLVNFPKDIHIFIDENISPTEKGSVIAKIIFSQGFKNIYLCTGYDPQDFDHVQGFVREVLGKDFPSHILC